VLLSATNLSVGREQHQDGLTIRKRSILDQKGAKPCFQQTTHRFATSFDDDDLPSDCAIAQFAAWYAIWTRSHCERLVAQQLMAKGFQPFLP